MNATVDVPAECTDVYVSVIDSADGKLNNVSVTGTVSVKVDPSSSENTTIHYSKLVGYPGLNFSGKSLKSNLKYSLNGEPVGDGEIKDYFSTNEPSCPRVRVSPLALTGEEHALSNVLNIHQKFGQPATEMQVWLSKGLSEHE